MIPKGLLPDGLGDVFIAGGFAACPALASDVDVWISTAEGTCEDTRSFILDHLRAHQFEFVEQDGADSPRGRVQLDKSLAKSQLLSTFEGYFLVLGLRRVATVTLPGVSLPYHLIVVEGSVDDVLSSFDITTHQVALTEKGVVKGEHWTPIWELPQIIQAKYTTPARIEKIRARYHMVTPKESNETETV